MENPEEYKRGLFEESFRKAFEGKEAIPPASVWEKLSWKKSFTGKSKGMSPPPAVWSNIQNELHPAAARIPFYKSTYVKMAAAAAVLFFVVIFGLNNIELDTSGQSISQNTGQNNVESSQSQSNSAATNENGGVNQREESSTQESISNSIMDSSTSSEPLTGANPETNNKSNVVIPDKVNAFQSVLLDESALFDLGSRVEKLSDLLVENRIKPDAKAISNLQLLNQAFEMEPLVSNTELARNVKLPIRLKSPVETTNLKLADVAPVNLLNPNKGFFTQLSLNAGTFDPNFTMQEGDIINAYALTVNSRESVAVPAQMGVNQTPESSMQIGLGLGYKIGKNLMIESGVQYANHSTTSISNVVSSPQHFSWAKPVTVAVTNEERLRPQLEFEITDAYQVRNAFEFVSVPLNIGFIIPMKKAEVLLKTGATANIFTGGEIIDPNGRLLTEFFKPGNASPYNTVFFQGMVATEVAYKISPSYSFGVQAGYFFAVSDLAKSDVLFSSQPNMYNLGFVMRYNLPRF